MVTNPRFQLSEVPLQTGRLIEQCFALWLASWRAGFWYSLLYGLVSLLPALTLGGLTSHVMRASLAVSAQTVAPWIPRSLRGDPADLLPAAIDWLSAPTTWLVLAACVFGVLASLSLLILRQDRVAHGADPGLSAATDLGLARLPRACGAWLIYSAILLVLTLPLIALTWFAFATALTVDLSGLLLLILGYLAGAVLASVPLVWASVALSFAPFASVIEGDGALIAQRHSARRVRGHWVHAALVVAVPLLVYFGISSTLSSFALVAAGWLAYALGGWAALFDGAWLFWSQLIATIPTALALPLATAGGVLGWHDLGLRRPVAE